MTSPRLFVDISSHGLGHLAQMAPVLDALAKMRPELRMTVRTGVPQERLRARIGAPFAYIKGRSDFGFVMVDAVRIDRAATGEAYRAFHADWAGRVATEAGFLRNLAPDLVLTDVAYLPLTGAALAGIPSMSMCSLNWADLFAHVFGHESWAPPIHAEILAAYRGAERFLRLTPAMPMPDLQNTCSVAPVATLGHDHRRELRERIGAAVEDRVVLIAFGGFDKDLNAAAWPALPGVRWLVPASWRIDRCDFAALESLRMNFTDLLRSVDAVLTKPGYGTFVEAACNGVPVLYVRRDDWPEQDCLIAWLHEKARCREVASDAVMRGALQDDLAELWRRPVPPLPSPDGAVEAARLIASYLP